MGIDEMRIATSPNRAYLAPCLLHSVHASLGTSDTFETLAEMPLDVIRND